MTAQAAVHERIAEYRNAHGGTAPKAVVVSRDEFTELLGEFDVLGSGDTPKVQEFKVCGVPIHVGTPRYPWGAFPTRSYGRHGFAP